MHALDQVHVWVQQLYRDMTFAEQTGMGKRWKINTQVNLVMHTEVVYIYNV